MATVTTPTRAEAPVATTSGWVPANPAPLGLAGFGMTTFVLSMINSNLVGGGSTPVVLGLALAYGGLAQLLAGMWEFRAGNTFGAVAFSSFGAFWISFFVLVQFEAKGLGTAAGSGVGLYLWAWAIFTGVMFLCTFTAPRALSLLFLLLTITFVLLGIGNSGASTNMIHAGGYVGLATAAVAIYLVAAHVMESVYGRAVLPIGAPK